MTSEISFRSGRIYSAFSVLLHKIAEFFISLHMFISINVLDFFTCQLQFVKNVSRETIRKTKKLRLFNIVNNHQHSMQSVEVWCSHKVLQSDSIPFISTQSVRVLNPPHE